MSIFVVGLFLALASLALVLHTRNVVVATLAEGAREAANADRTCADGEARIRALLPQVRLDLACDDTGDVVEVRGRAALPLHLTFTATAHARKEGR